MKEQKQDKVAVRRNDPQGAEMTRDLPVATPDTDIYEYPDRVVVCCDMPGVLPGEADVGLENDVLTLTGTGATPDPEGYELLHRGFVPSQFRRVFTLTADVDRGRIEATLKNGVLVVTLPKAAEAQPRKIAVRSG